MSSLRISFEKKSSRASTCDWQKLHHRVGSRREPAHLRGAFQSRWLMIVCKKLGGGLVRGANWMGYLWRSAIRHRRTRTDGFRRSFLARAGRQSKKLDLECKKLIFHAQINSPTIRVAFAAETRQKGQRGRTNNEKLMKAIFRTRAAVDRLLAFGADPVAQVPVEAVRLAE